MQLVVEIQKHLPNYTLDVAFQTNGKPLGILGASGSGKSMTLRCIAGIETPTSGRILLNDRILFDSQKGINLPSRERRIGYLFQSYALFPHKTIAQNIAYGLKGWTRSKKAQQVAMQLEWVQLQGMEHRYPHQLSGGQQQRVALARALAPQPEGLLLDEPFAALDTHLRSALERQLIKTLAHYEGVTLFVTHNLEEAYRIADELLVLSQGKVAAFGEKHSIFQHPPTIAVAQLTGCKNISRIRWKESYWKETQTLEALDWECLLQVQLLSKDQPCAQPSPPAQDGYVGIRAHHLRFLEAIDTEHINSVHMNPDHINPEHSLNTFPVWLAWKSETPHHITLYLTLHRPPTHENDYHLQAEIFREKWDNLKVRPFPWFVQLDPAQLFITAR
jgi:molybdate transport system permease protein